MVSLADVVLPDGQHVLVPVEPRTWQHGDRVQAKDLSHDVAGTVAHGRSRPMFLGAQTTAQAVPAFTWIPLNLDSVSIDAPGGHSDPAHPSRWYPPITSGAIRPPSGFNDWYLAIGQVSWNSQAGDAVHIAGLRVVDAATGPGTVFEGAKLPGHSGHALTTPVVDLIAMAGNDYLELMAWQSTAGSVNTAVGGKVPTLSVRWVATDYGSPAPTPPLPHTWTSTDRITSDDAGADSDGHALIPANREIRDIVRLLNHPPIARLTSQGSAQTIPTSGTAWTSIRLPTVTVDTYGGHSAGSDTRYTAQVPGLYLIAGYLSVAEAGTNTGYRAARLAAGGGLAYGGMTSIPMTSGTIGTALHAIGLIRLAVGDFVEVQAQHTQGSALTVRADVNDACRLVAVWLAA